MTDGRMFLFSSNKTGDFVSVHKLFSQKVGVSTPNFLLLLIQTIGDGLCMRVKKSPHLFVLAHSSHVTIFNTGKRVSMMTWLQDQVTGIGCLGQCSIFREYLLSIDKY